MNDPSSILIVDDDADVRESLGEALEGEGYRVATAANGAEALRLLKVTGSGRISSCSTS